MKFKTRLRVTFITIILLPLFLTAIAFCAIGLYLTSVQRGLPVAELSYENMQELMEATDKAFTVLKEQTRTDASKLSDKAYLHRINTEIARRSTDIIVRKGRGLYYAGNVEEAQAILPVLPDYGDADLSEESGIYYGEFNRFVKQLDFLFPDGEEGSVFVVTKANALISRHLLVDMFVAIFLILIFTGLMLTRWIHKGVFHPVTELNTAMREIKEGNFEYALETGIKGEIGDLYHNYEDMRLRLKESTEENRENEKQNRELISNISHDLKTPITAIKGYVEGIMDGVADTPEKMDKYIKTIYHKANDK